MPLSQASQLIYDGRDNESWPPAFNSFQTFQSFETLKISGIDLNDLNALNGAQRLNGSTGLNQDFVI